MCKSGLIYWNNDILPASPLASLPHETKIRDRIVIRGITFDKAVIKANACQPQNGINSQMSRSRIISSEIIEKLRPPNFQGSLLSTFPLYTPHCQIILLKQTCCLLLNGFSRESQKRTSVLQTKRAFYDSYKCWTFAELYEAFTFLIENIDMQFEGVVYQQIVGIPSHI